MASMSPPRLPGAARSPSTTSPVVDRERADSLRHRKQGGGEAAAAGERHEAGWEDAREAPEARARTRAPAEAYANASRGWLQDIVARIVNLWRCLTVRAGAQAQKYALTGEQREKVERLRKRADVPYDGENEEHREKLRELWRLAFPGEPLQALKHAQWKNLGYQSEDPTTDFRGAGMLALDQLIYFGKQEPRSFQKLIHKTDGKRAEWEYPFAAAGTNVTMAVLEISQFAADSASLGPTAGAAVLTPRERAAASAASFRMGQMLVEEGDDTADDLFVTLFLVLDRVWLRRGASYMEFNSVLKEAKAELVQALSASTENDIDAVRRALCLQPVERRTYQPPSPSRILGTHSS